MKTYQDYKNKLIELIEKHDLIPHQDKILEIAQDNIIIRKTEQDDYSELGNSRFGGYPDLPEGFQWPKSDVPSAIEDTGKFCQFLGQINLTDISLFQDKLPKNGMLYFFIGSNSYYGHIDNENREDAGIFYYPEQIKDVEIYSLTRPDFVLETEDEDADLDNSSSLKNPYKVTFEQSMSLPYWGDVIFQQTMDLYKDEYSIKDPIEISKYESLYREYMDFQKDNNNIEHLTTMFGYIWSDDVNVRENAGFYDGRSSNPENWEILLNFQSDSDIGFTFGDYGFFYFLVHKDDLNKLDFSLLETGTWSY